MTQEKVLIALDKLKLRLDTWRAVAAELGTTPQTIQNWRAGRYEPRARHLRKLAEVLGNADKRHDEGWANS